MTNPNEPIRNETCDYAYEYLYDQNGNILKKTQINGTEVTYEDTYIYDETIKDRLNRITRHKNNQTTTHYELTYDQNFQFWPSQMVKNNINYQLLWQGPQLMSLGHYQYQYNEHGIRVKKTGGGVNIKYDVDGTQVIRSTNLINNKTILYHFDQNGQLIGLNYSGKDYVYQRNILGEIYGIMDLNGKQIIHYSYNAYGVPSITLGTNLSSSETIIASDIAELNIYLYKGYIYDQETNLYYCQTRYYDPEVGRWLSIDHIAYLDSESIGGLNLYAYCGNNPVMYFDPSGRFAISTFLISLAVGWALTTVATNIFGHQLVGGVGSIINGVGAINTGISLMAFGPWGIALGIGLIAVGTVTVAFGVNEIVAGSTGINAVKDWMGGGLYDGLYMGFNIASGVGQIAGNIGMRYASNKILNSIVQNPAKVQNYRIGQMRTYGRYTSQFKPGVMQHSKSNPGGGYTLTHVKGAGNGYIQWHPGGSRWHFNGAPYWKVTSNFIQGAWRGIYLF